jgi:hypothetical protein
MYSREFKQQTIVSKIAKVNKRVLENQGMDAKPKLISPFSAFKWEKCYLTLHHVILSKNVQSRVKSTYYEGTI